MAINQILNVPDWRQLSSATASLPASSYTKLLPVTDNYWYGLDSTGRVRKIGYEKQYYAGFSQSSLPSPSTSDSRVDVNIGAGLTFTTSAQYSQIVVSGVTMGNLNISNPYSSGFVLGLNSTASGQFEWVGVSGSIISGSTNSLARFTAPNALGDSIVSDNGSQAFIGSVSALSGVSFSVTGDVQVDDTIYFGANANRFIGRTNTSDIDIQTTGNFRVSAYTNSSYKVIESLNNNTNSRSIQFLSGTTSTGLVSINNEVGKYSLQIVTSSSSPSIALGISGSILYQDGSQGFTGSIMVADGSGKLSLFALPKSNQVVFGNAAGDSLTSSTNFQFWNSGGSLLAGTGSSLSAVGGCNVLLGGSGHLIATSSNSSIIGGSGSIITSCSIDSSIIGGVGNRIGSGNTTTTSIVRNSIVIGGCGNIMGTASLDSTIIGGKNNRITDCSWQSSIIASEESIITGATFAGQALGYQWWSNHSLIGGGNSNKICRATNSGIIGGGGNLIWHAGPLGNYTLNNTIMGGKYNCIRTYGFYDSIVGGLSNSIVNRSCSSVILGGSGNRIFMDNWNLGTIGNNNSAILGGVANSLETFRNNGHCMSTIIGGNLNRMGCVTNTAPLFCGNCRSSIISGFQNVMICASNDSLILGGRNNFMENLSCNSAIIGASGGSMSNSCNSLILGGSGLTLSSTNNMVYLPSLMIATISASASATKILTWDDTSRRVLWRDISSFSGSVTSIAGGLTGTGTNNYVPVWNGTKELTGTSSIWISNSGTENVGIKTTTPAYSLQIKTYSGSPTIALGLSGGFIYHDGSQGTTGSVMMTDATGKAYLYPLILPAPGITASVARVAGSYGSGYLPLYVGEGKTSGPSGSSEYQIGPILTDNLGSDLSLLIEPQVQFHANNPAATNRNMTLVVPSLVNTVPSGLTVSVDFLMDYGDQTVYGQKTFNKNVVLGSQSNLLMYADNNTNYTSFAAPNGLVTNIEYVLPSTIASSNGRFLRIGGISGATATLDWTAALTGLNTFIQTGFFANGATLSGTTIQLGAAGTQTPGLVHTGTQYFKGDKYFYDDIYVGATNSDIDASASIKFITGGTQTFFTTGLVASDLATSNMDYILPVSPTAGLYLKVSNVSGGSASLIWATAAGGSSALSRPADEVVFGNGSAVSSSPSFKFVTAARNLISSNGGAITSATDSVILGGGSNNICLSTCVNIIGGCSNNIRSEDNVTIIGGYSSRIGPTPTGTASRGVTASVIISGSNNFIEGPISKFNTIINGNNQCICGANGGNSTIIGGFNNTVGASSLASTIIGGDANLICCGQKSTIIGGNANDVCSDCSTIISSKSSCIYNTSDYSVVIGGNYNKICGTATTFATIINGNNQQIIGATSNNSAIIGGDTHLIATQSNNSVLIGGSTNKICSSSNSVILGGSSLTLNGESNKVLVPSLKINNPGSQNNALTNVLVLDGSGNVCTRAASSLGGTLALDNNEVAFGTGTGVTTSNNFTFNPTLSNIVVGNATINSIGTPSNVTIINSSSCIGMTSNNSAIIGGGSHTIGTSSCNSSIFGGSSNRIIRSNYSSTVAGILNCICIADRSSIIGGSGNSVCNILIPYSTANVSILAGACNCICNASGNAIIAGGCFNMVHTNSCDSTISGGFCNIVNSSNRSSIIAGCFNRLTGCSESAILSGVANCVCNSQRSIMGGFCNVMCCNFNTVILGGQCNYIKKTTGFLASNFVGEIDSVILGGFCNQIVNGSNGYVANSGGGSGIISGRCNCIDSSYYGGILGGASNTVGKTSSQSVILGGFNNTICNSDNSAIIGGNSLTLTGMNQMVFVPQLRINSVTQNNTLTDILVLDACGRVCKRAASSIGGGSVTLGLDQIGVGDGAGVKSFGNFLFNATSSRFTVGSLATCVNNSCNVSIITSTNSSVISSTNSSIFGGSGNFITGSNNSIILGGTGLTVSNRSNVVLVPSLLIGSRNTTNTNEFITTDSLPKRFVYQLPSTQSLPGQFLRVDTVDSSAAAGTYSTSWGFPNVGTGLTISVGGTISLSNFIPSIIINLPGTYSGSYSVTLPEVDRLYEVTTGDAIYTIFPPATSSVPTSGEFSGHEFRVSKKDNSQGTVVIPVRQTDGSSPWFTLTRQNQMVGIKFDRGSQSWVGYNIDLGYIPPNTVLGNFGSTHAYAKEYEVTDYNDTTQKALNYISGAFTNDWQSGLVYSSVDPKNISGSGTYFSLLQTTAFSYIGSNIVPTFSMIRGRMLRARISGTYSAPINSDFIVRIGSATISSFTYGLIATASNFELECIMKVRYGGASGSVYGGGMITFDEGSRGSAVYSMGKYNVGFVDVNLAQTNTLDVLVRSSVGSMNMTINSSTIERLA